MALRETVKVVKEDSDRGYMIIPRERYDPERHVRYENRDRQGVSYQLAKNGYWSVYKGGEKIEGGRGTDALDDALARLNSSRDEATER